MKELYEFNNWASNLIEQSLLEKNERSIRREIPVSHDIQYQALRKYPDRDPAQALSLYLADKLENIDDINYKQNTVINAQRQENIKLKDGLSQLRQELENIEDSSANTDVEINRLKALSGQLKSEVETRKASSKEIDELLAQVEQLKNKPGMSSELYNELKQKIESAEGKNVNAEEFKKITGQIKDLQNQQDLEKDDLTTLKNTASSLLTQRNEIASTREELSDLLNSIKTEKENLDNIVGNVMAEKEAALAAKKEAEKTLTLVRNPKELVRQSKAFKDYANAVQKRSKQASTLIKNFLNNTLPTIQNSIEDLDTSDAQQDEQIKVIAQKTGTSLSTDIQRRSSVDEPIPDTVAARAALGSTSDDSSIEEPDDEPINDPGVGSLISKYVSDFDDTSEENPDEESFGMNTNKNTQKVKENANQPIMLTPHQRLWISTLNKMISESDPAQIERLLVIMKNYPEDVVMRTLLKDGHNLYKKFGEHIIGAGHLRLINDHIIKVAERAGLPTVKFRSSNDPILHAVLKKYKKWVNETEKTLRDIENLYAIEQDKQRAYSERERVPGHMLNLDNNVHDKFVNTTLEESIDKMIDEIIGQDVARWIK